MYVYTPAQKKTTAIMMSAIMFFIAAACLIFSKLFDFKAIWQLLCVGFLVAGIQITSRFVLMSFRYTLSDLTLLHEANDLKIERIQGNKRRVVANISLETKVALIPKLKQSEMKKRYGHINRIFNFTVNPFYADSWMYIFEFNDETNVIILECDKEFVRQFRLRTEAGMNINE